MTAWSSLVEQAGQRAEDPGLRTGKGQHVLCRDRCSVVVGDLGQQHGVPAGWCVTEFQSIQHPGHLFILQSDSSSRREKGSADDA